MDYKYIEQVLERYWECQTTLEEEAILRSFFAQTDIPASLLPYRCLFTAEEDMAREHLGEDFEQRVMKVLGQEVQSQVAKVEPMRFSFSQRLRPLWHAAAMVAVVLTIGMAAQQGFQDPAEVQQEPQLAGRGEATDTLQLFIDMPEPLQQAEATLVSTQADTLKAMTP